MLAAGFEGLGARLRGAGAHARGAARSTALLGAVLTACVGLGIVWVLGAVALRRGRRAAPRGPALDDPAASSTRSCRRPAPLLNALARFDPFPRIDGPEVRVQAPPRGRSRGDPEVDAAARSVVKVLGTACGLGVEGSGWVAGDGHRRHQRPRGGRPGRHARAAAGRGARHRRAGGRLRPAQRHRGAAGRRAAGAGARAGRLAAHGHLGRRPRVPAQRALRRARRPPRGDARGRHPGRLRPRAGAPGDHLAARRRALRQLRRPDGRRRAAAWSATVFAATTSGPRGGYGVPNAVVRSALGGARGPVSTGPCA